MSTTNPESPKLDSLNTTPPSDPNTAEPTHLSQPHGAVVIPFPAPVAPRRTKADIARENGAKSKGPKTASGKKRSRMNAATHYFTAKHCSYSNQNHTEVNKIHRDLCLEFNPQSPTELAFVDTMALCKWQEQSAAEELTAYVNHTRDLHFNDPSYSEALKNVLAIEKLTADSRTFENHQRYLRDAERRHARTVREFFFFRKNCHLLEIESESSVDSDADADADADDGIDAAAQQNEPTQAIENAQPASTAVPTPPSVYPESEPLDPAVQAALSDVPFIKNTGPSVDRWEILKVINRHLLPFPEAFRAVADAVCAHEDKRLGKTR